MLNEEQDEENEKNALEKYFATFRKKPVEITAVLFDGSTESLIALNSSQFGLNPVKLVCENDKDYIIIPTLEGNMRASVGDYIIRGVNGEFYPCKPDVFNKTYDKVK